MILAACRTLSNIGGGNSAYTTTVNVDIPGSMADGTGGIVNIEVAILL